MKQIELSQGKVTLVSDEDFEYLNQWKWTFDRYAYRQPSTTLALGRQRPIRMHRVIVERMTGANIPDSHEVDHIDANGLNNQRENLRVVTPAQNQMNRRGHRDSASQYKGVSPVSRRGMWQSQLRFRGKHYFLGHFINEEDAARAYDAKARELFGEFARLNFPDGA